MIINSLDNDSRRILIDASQVYEVYLEVDRQYRDYKGSMKWIKRNGKEYLFRRRNSRGDGRSLGARDERTQEIYRQFYEKKNELTSKRKSLIAELRRHRGYCQAAGIANVPKVTADIVRIIQQAKQPGSSSALIVVGTNAMFAYENMAGVRFERKIMTTIDIDFLWDVRQKLSLAGDSYHRNTGLLPLLKKADNTFAKLSNTPFRAANEKGFMVDLIKSAPANVHKTTPSLISSDKNDLVAAEIRNLDWLYAVSPVSATVFGSDGFPVVFDVPDPRVFAAHKLWLSEQQDRAPLKKTRDREQGLAVLRLLKEYLHNYPPDAEELRGLPLTLRNKMLEEYDRLDVNWDSESAPAPGFEI